MKRPLPLAILSAAGLAPTQTLGEVATYTQLSMDTAGQMEGLHPAGK